MKLPNQNQTKFISASFFVPPHMKRLDNKELSHEDETEDDK